MSCQKMFITLQKMRNTQSKIKPIKLEKNSRQRIVWDVKILQRIFLDHKK